MAKKSSSDDFRIENIYNLQLQQKDLYASYCPTKEPFQVYIAEEALRDIYQHAMMGYKQGKGEIAGALIGNVYSAADHNVTFVEINSSISANTRSSTAAVEIPKEEWHRISEKIENDPRYRLRSTVVGWYHSHPGFGVFMSGTDRSTQQSHFGLDWQVAIVVDPVKKQIGTFYGPNIKECSLYKLPNPDIDRSLTTADELLDRIVGGKVPVKDVPTAVDSSVYQQLADIKNHIEEIRGTQGNMATVLASIRAVVNNSEAQIPVSNNRRIQTQLIEIRQQINEIQDVQTKFIASIQDSLEKGERDVVSQAGDQEIMGMIQGVEASIDNLAKRVANQIDQSRGATSRELRETQSILDQIRLSFDLVKAYQNSIVQMSSNFQDIVAISLRQFQDGLRESLNASSGEIKSVKEKIEGLQQIHMQNSEALISKADSISVKIDTLNEDVASSTLTDRLWGALKYRLLVIAVGVLILSFLGGVGGTTWIINRRIESGLSFAQVKQMTQTPPVTEVLDTPDLPSSTPDPHRTTKPGLTFTATLKPTLTQSPISTIAITDPRISGIITRGGVNIRSGPGIEYDIVGVTTYGTSVFIIAKSENEDWYQIITTDDAIHGWIFATFIEIGSNANKIPVVTLTLSPTPTP